MANKNESSNSTMITLIVIVIIALGILFFLKPFGGNTEVNNKEESKKTTIEYDKSLPDDSDVKPVDNPPVKKPSEDKK